MNRMTRQPGRVATAVTGIFFAAVLLAGCSGASEATVDESDGTEVAGSQEAEAAPQEPVEADVPDVPGSWGGVTFPGRVGEYRLVGEAEYAEFREAYPGGTVCTYLGGALAGNTSVSDGARMTQAPYAMALYTTSADSMASLGCDFNDTGMSVTVTQGGSIGFLESEPANANGIHCAVVATNMCALQDGGVWVAADYSSSVELPEVAEFLASVRAGG